MRSLRPLVLVGAVLATAMLLPAVASAAGDCPNGMRCETVRVPLDRSGATPGTLGLRVVAQRGDRPLLLVLTGGPGQSGASLAAGFAPVMNAVAPRFRIAMLDQRGTGPDGLDCPAMQRAALTDLTVPPPGSVEACGRRLGAARAFYTTTDTVADLEAVRRALGVDRMAIMGTSYGTYVAERYARAYPDRVSHLVLDSVVPQENVDPFFAASMRRAGTVLRQLCAGGACRPATRRPVADLRALVERLDRTPIRLRVEVGGRRVPVVLDGPAMFDLTISLSSFLQGELTLLPTAVRGALDGDPRLLRAMYRHVRRQQRTPVRSLSWGLHTATLCGDLALPWGTAAAPAAGRTAAVAARLRTLPAGHFGPFGRRTAQRNGALLTCRRWQPTPVAPAPAPGPLPAVPILMVAGSWDLSTPVEDARREARRAPTAKLVVVPEAGHSVITAVPCAQIVLARFLAGRPLGRPCARHRAPRPGAPATSYRPAR
ncbi:MAG TPA: alpha/beta fold hydrolase [Capillimicrobium sp.]|nr:alpha/beta fold hydrolase [Capillimicrobium sp.]